MNALQILINILQYLQAFLPILTLIGSYPVGKETDLPQGEFMRSGTKGAGAGVWRELGERACEQGGLLSCTHEL